MKLNARQRAKVESLLEGYNQISFSIEKKEEEIKNTKKMVLTLLDQLEKMRSEELEWTKSESEKEGVSEEEFTQAVKSFGMVLKNIRQ